MLFIITPIGGVCNFSMFCCTLLYVHYNFAIILIGKTQQLVDLLRLSSWCLVIVVWFLLAVPYVCLQFVIVVFPDHKIKKLEGDYKYFSLILRTWVLSVVTYPFYFIKRLSIYTTNCMQRINKILMWEVLPEIALKHFKIQYRLYYITLNNGEF